MKQDIHPAYHIVKFACSCGNTVEAGSTIAKESVHIDVCGKCHPFYTGKQKLVDTGGRLQKFRERYGKTSTKEGGSQTTSAA